MSKTRAFRDVYLLIAGALPWFLLYAAYRLFTLVFSQIGVWRTLGLVAVVVLVLAAIAVLPALVATRLPTRSRLAWLSRLVFLVAALGNLAAIGLSLFYDAPAFAPTLVKGAVAVLLGGAVIRVMTQPAETRDFVLMGMTRLGLVALVVPMALSPLIVADAATQVRPSMTVTPVPTGTPVLPNRPRHILLISLDSLRAQSTSIHNPEVETPALGKFARSATTFMNCRAAGERTLVSMLTTLTGIQPQFAIPFVNNRLGYIRQGTYTGIAGHLRVAGYRGAYFTMKVGPDIFGLLPEFETGRQNAYFLPSNDFNGQDYLPLREVSHWISARINRRPEPSKVGIQHEIPATRETFRLARAHLKGATESAFVWVHIGAPHLPYYDVPTSDLGGTLRPRHYRKITHEHGLAADAEGLIAIEQVYQRYTRFVDAELGLFLDGLERDGRLADSLVIVMSDHGEAFTPGQFPHGQGRLPEAVTHVPLLIHRPGQTTGERVQHFVGHVDLLPTVLGRVYNVLPNGLSGRDLLASTVRPQAVQSWGRYERYTERETMGDEVAVYEGTYKLLQDHVTGQDALFDLTRDPGAARDIASRHPELVARMRTRITPDAGR